MNQGMSYRADLHVHSRCSGDPTNAGIRALGGRESYTDPLEVYASAKARGMDFVTITDHNTLAGSLAIAHLPDTFPSCEFDTWFPDDCVRVHVVALNIDEDQFAEAARARASVYDLTACLREAGVCHFLAHPLFDMTDALTPDHVEKLLLLFNVLEGVNGSRVHRCNGLLREIVDGLTPDAVRSMAERQGIEPWGETPWRKSLTGGSDDHSGLFVAGAHTVSGGDGTVSGFLAALERGECAPAGEDGDARLLAHSIYAASFWRIREILRLDDPTPPRRALRLLNRGFGPIGGHVPLLEKAVHGVRRLAPGLYREGDGRGPAWEALLEREIGALLADPQCFDSVGSGDLNRRLFTVVRQLTHDVTSLHLRPVLAGDPRASLPQILRCAFAVGMVHFLELSYFIAWSVQSRDRASQRRLATHFLDRPPDPGKVAVFTDSGAEEDGPLRSIRGLVAAAAERGIGVEVLTSKAEPTARKDGMMSFEAIACRPGRGGDQRDAAIPSVLDVLDYVEQSAFTAVHIDTTGAVGVVGLVAAKLLHLPVTGRVRALPSRPTSAAASRETPGPRKSQKGAGRSRGILLCRFMDAVYVPSREVACQLAANRVDPGRIRMLPDGAGPEAGEAYVEAILAGVAMAPPRPARQRRARPVGSVDPALERGAEG